MCYANPQINRIQYSQSGKATSRKQNIVMPISVIKLQHIAVPIVVPKLAEVRNIPLAKSGASGAASVIIYCILLLAIPANTPKIRMTITIAPIFSNDEQTDI